MKKFLLVLFLIFIFQVFRPAQTKAQGLYGCNWISTRNICQGYVNCENGYTHIPANIQDCYGLNIQECNQRNYTCTPVATLASVSTGTASIIQCPNRPGTINTAIGCIDFNDINLTSQFFLRWLLGIAGGVALFLIGLASYQIATSQGHPRRLQGGQELLLSAIGGLIMIILSVFLLRFIGVDLLGIF